jgi:hypothetical protein
VTVLLTLNLFVNSILTSTTNETICTNQLPYSWNGQPYNVAGTYTKTLSSVAGCDSVATLNLFVNSILTSTTNETICTNQLPYSWNGQTYNVAGTYTKTLSSVAGCDSVATLKSFCQSILTQHYKRNNLHKPIAIFMEWPNVQCSWHVHKDTNERIGV